MRKFIIGDTVKLISNKAGSNNKVGEIGKIVKDGGEGQFLVKVGNRSIDCCWSFWYDLELTEINYYEIY